jgi:hypothetical protein
MPWLLCRISEEGQTEEGTTEWTLHEGVEISDEEKDRLLNSLKILEEDAEQEPRNLVLRNFQDMFWYKGHLVQEYEALVQVPEVNPLRRLASELRGRLFHWLQSVRAYLDHTETRLKRRYGADSNEVATFKQVCAAVFDRYFAYRFLHRLRNAQHVDFSPVEVSVSESVGPSGREISASARFVRDELLNKFRKWGSVKEELAEFPETFSLDEHVITMMQCLDVIAHEVASIERPHLEEQSQTVAEFHARVPHGRGVPALVWLPPEGEPLRRMQHRVLPMVKLKNPEPVPDIVGRPSGRGDDWDIYRYEPPEQTASN